MVKTAVVFLSTASKEYCAMGPQMELKLNGNNFLYIESWEASGSPSTITE